MGNRPRNGGRHSPSASFAGILLRRIRSSNLESLDPDAVVNHLRSHFPDYARIKLQPFSHRVHQALQSIRPQQSFNGAETPGPPSRRRRLREDDGEQRLLLRESEHLRCKRRLQELSSSSTASTDDDSTSTSDDAVFKEKLEPEFDITKSMLRESYGKRAEVTVKKPRAKLEENMEIEPATMKKLVRGVDLNGKEGRSWGETSVVEGKSGGSGLVREDRPRFRDFGGIKRVLDELIVDVVLPLLHPEVLRALGIRPMSGILFHGPPGCGKTRLAQAIANEAGVPLYEISATEVVSGVSGASEENIRELFRKAYRTAPSIIFIDEIDAIASKRDNMQREMERRIVTQLMTCMDESHQTLGSGDPDSESEVSTKKPGYVLVIGSTNRPDAIDHALRRPGRFDREIVLGVPNENARAEILSVLTLGCPLEGGFDFFKIARSTPGFVGADLRALVYKAGKLPWDRLIDRRRSELSSEAMEKYTEEWWRRPWAPEEVARLTITMADFEEAAKIMQPSSRREGFSKIPDVTWDDVGGLHQLREEFEHHIVQRIKNPDAYEAFGVNLEAGFLLYGPPGCGKTLIAQAVANAAGVTYRHIKGPELLNKFVGESELAVRTLFSQARTCSPCVLFFDEVDALSTNRGNETGSGVERLLNQLLIELDGADQRRGIYVIGATNRMEVIDPALLRPGRLGKVLYVPLPNADERGSILKTLARKKPIAAEVDLDALAHREECNNLSGADLSALMNEAAMIAMKEIGLLSKQGFPVTKASIKNSHFEEALKRVFPSVSEEQRRYYEAVSQNFRKLR